MLFLGHRFIPSEPLYHINEIEDIPKTPPNSIVYFPFEEKNLDIIQHCQVNAIRFSLEVKTIEELLYAASFRAQFVLTRKKLAKQFQEIVENYLLEMKVIAHIQSETEIEEMALLGIDGVVFPSGIVKIS